MTGRKHRRQRGKASDVQRRPHTRDQELDALVESSDPAAAHSRASDATQTPVNPSEVVAMQRVMGNRAVNQLLKPRARRSGRKETSRKQPLSALGTTSGGVVQLSLDEFNTLRRQAGIAPAHPIESLPPSREDRRDGGLYYDASDEGLEALCRREAVPQRATYPGRGTYIIGYPLYRIYFTFGRGAVWLRGNRSERRITAEELRAMYRHEREHQRQYQAMRRVDVELARRNNALNEQIGRFTLRAEIARIVGLMTPIDPEIWHSRRQSEHLTSARAIGTRGETGGVDLTSHANREVLAHATAFAQSIGSIDAALVQLRQLTGRIPRVGDTPEWSYDRADASAKQRTIHTILTAIAGAPQGQDLLNDRIIPDLQASTRGAEGSTSLLEHLLSCMQYDVTGQMMVPPENEWLTMSIVD